LKKVHVAFLWHQHQPIYKNPQTNVYELPWPRLHASKDYYDMAAILDDFPKIKLNFNFVPSLLVQLEEYALGKAVDKHLLLTLKNAADLTQEDKVFILLNFFAANWDNMISKNNRYLQLLEQRGHHTSEQELINTLSFFKEQDFRDLQVWFNLAWFDPYWRQHDQFIAWLYKKGRNFHEDEKQELIRKQLEICGKVVQKHKELQDKGQIEVSVSPFYHPILPLLCDTDVAKEAMPNVTLLEDKYAYPEDAKWQIDEGIKYYENAFGKKPNGMWPSEGSVSNQVCDLIADGGINWIATDEAVLFNSRHELASDRKNLFKPYVIERNGKKLNIIFRDHGLSDLIGFTYAKWNPQDAANDFMARLYDIRNYIGDSCEAPLVSIILDGENCWEYYANDGRDFLMALYKRLSETDDFETVRINDYLQSFPPTETINSLVAGSWINGNFQIWIGDIEDRNSWVALKNTRDFLYSFLNANPSYKDSPAKQEALTALRCAQASDWNWWYGMEHASDSDAVFDFLYRKFLMKVYQVFEQPVPEGLYVPIKTTMRQKYASSFKAPTGFIYPKLDGKINSDWNACGEFSSDHMGGSMHQVSHVIRKICFGRNEHDIFIGIQLNSDVFAKTIKNLEFKLCFVDSLNASIDLVFDADKNLTKLMYTDAQGSRSIPNAVVCFGQDMEICAPIEFFGLSGGAILKFRAIVFQNGFELEQAPNPQTMDLGI
jgi:alpha-amylase/alpha-mannosidase (GH57 family)